MPVIAQPPIERLVASPKRRKLFPTGPIRLGQHMLASLHEVERTPEGDVFGVYELDTTSDTGDALTKILGSRPETVYTPLPGLQASFVPHDFGGGDEPAFRIGLTGEAARQRATAMRRMQVDTDALVSPFLIRFLYAGFLSETGISSDDDLVAEMLETPERDR